MITCLICKKEFSEKSFTRHCKKHYSVMYSNLLYIQEYLLSFNIVDAYLDDMKSAETISKLINSEISWFKCSKHKILGYLKKFNVVRRTTSAAGKNYYAMGGKLWNKGLTKNDHPAIMAYSKARMGKNNPCYKNSDEVRKEKCYWNIKATEECNVIKTKISQSLKDGYTSGKIVHISKSNPAKFKEIHAAMLRGFQNYKEKSGRYHIRVSSHELRINKILEDLEESFIKQKVLTGGRRYYYDFFIPGRDAVIEINGDYWHCNPDVYEEDYFHEIRNKIALEIWKYDQEKRNFALNNGIKNYVVIWEHEINERDDIQLKEYLLEILKNYGDC